MFLTQPNSGAGNLRRHKFPFLLLSLIAIFTVPQLREGMRDFGNRLEGTAVESHGREDLLLLGIHRSFENFSQDANLQIGFYLPKQLPERKASGPLQFFIEAREIQDTKHYFMQAKAANWISGRWNVFGPWPTKDVIDPLHLDPYNIVVRAGYPGRDGLPVYLPVDVFHSSHPTRERYTFYFITSWDIHELEVTIAGALNQTVRHEVTQCQFAADCIVYAAGTSHAFDVDMATLPEGIYLMTIRGRVPRTTTQPTLVLRFYHYPVDKNIQ